MTTADIESHIRDILRHRVSDSTFSRVTDKILPVVKEWQSRRWKASMRSSLWTLYTSMSASEGQIVKKAVYI
jgi:transposase-like protein